MEALLKFRGIAPRRNWRAEFGGRYDPSLMARFHCLGETRQSAEGSGFFRWFMLEPVEAESPAPGRSASHYRPNGPAFHTLTEVVLTTDDQDELLALELRLSRGFIDHDHHGLFARDITKSLLRDGIEGADRERISDLITQIEFPGTVRVPSITARTADAPVPDTPTPGYECYLGTRGRWELRGATVHLILENYLRDATPWFRMSLMGR